MAIELWEGTPGSGKTSSCIVDAIEFLTMGGVVFSNFTLREGWALEIAKHDMKVRLGLRDPVKLAREYYKRWLTIGSIKSVVAASLMVDDLVTGSIKNRFEGKAIVILDEVQLMFNSRDWAKNFAWIEYFTQHRKYKVDVRLIAHDIEMVDSQIRPLVEYRVSCRNLAKVRVPFLGVPMSYFYGGGSIFLAVWRYAGKGGGHGLKLKSKTMRLQKWSYGLFDSHRIFSKEDVLSDEVQKIGGAPALPVGCRSAARPLPEIQSFFNEIKENC
jgi:hypothetical protein